MFKDVGFRVFLQVFFDSGDEVACGFIHVVNLTVKRYMIKDEMVMDLYIKTCY